MSENKFDKYIKAYDEGKFTRAMLESLVEKLKERHRTRQLADDPYDASQVRARGCPDNPFAGGSFRDDPYPTADDPHDADNRRGQIRRSNNPYDAGGR